MCKGEDSASTMQKTGWTNCSSFLVWSGKRFFTLNVVTGGQSTAIFGIVTNKQPNSQPKCKPALTNEKAVFCKMSQNMCSLANAHCPVL